jgi:hypothetical protein
MQPANKPTIMGVALCHKKIGDSCPTACNQITHIKVAIIHSLKYHMWVHMCTLNLGTASIYGNDMARFRHIFIKVNKLNP